MIGADSGCAHKPDTTAGQKSFINRGDAPDKQDVRIADEFGRNLPSGTGLYVSQGRKTLLHKWDILVCHNFKHSLFPCISF
jgi:hypothetical protein